MHLRQFGGPVYGVDIARTALDLAATRGLTGQLAQGSLDHLPFRSGTFDVITSFDVVYHLRVSDDQSAFNEMWRVLRPGGLLLLRVPAHDWLRGSHDRLVHTRHRYSRRELRQKLNGAGFAIEQLYWANCILFPIAVAKRLLERDTLEDSESSEPDLRQLSPRLSAMLERLITFEVRAMKHSVQLPFGLSLLALARKV